MIYLLDFFFTPYSTPSNKLVDPFSPRSGREERGACWGGTLRILGSGSWPRT